MLGLSYSMWDLVPQPGIESRPLHWEKSLSHTGPPGKPEYFFIFWHTIFQAQLHSAYPSPGINCFSEEPSEPRLFVISVSCPFHQLMLCLKPIWLDHLVHFSKKHTVQVGGVCTCHSAWACGYSWCSSVHVNCPTGMIRAGGSGRVGRQRSGLEGRKGDGVDIDEEWRGRLGDPGRDSNRHIWVLSATRLGKSENLQTFQKEVRIFEVLSFCFVFFSPRFLFVYIEV